MRGGDGVYSGERVYGRVPGDIAHSAHRAHSVDATDAFVLGGAMVAFVMCWLAWWLSILPVLAALSLITSHPRYSLTSPSSVP
jgi:hypothetical protein